MLYKKIMSFLDSQNLLYKNQFVFRAEHLTILPVLQLINQCAKNNNSYPRKYTL